LLAAGATFPTFQATMQWFVLFLGRRRYLPNITSNDAMVCVISFWSLSSAQVKAKIGHCPNSNPLSQVPVVRGYF
jgi:hypothetical protein